MIQIHRFSKFLILILASLCSQAEYRVYQYIIRANQPSKTPQSYIVTSTLSPTDYLAYHGGSHILKIDLGKTWTCLGNTSGKDICPDPALRLEAQVAGEIIP